MEALPDVQTDACARLLFAELRRVKSSNTTRRYLEGVIKSLAAMPPVFHPFLPALTQMLAQATV